MNSKINQVRYLSLFEGYSLLFLVFIAVPLKYFFNFPWGSQIVGPIHGVMFLLFLFQLLHLAYQLKWGIFKTAWILLISSFIPLGAFYVDHKILKPMVQKAN